MLATRLLVVDLGEMFQPLCGAVKLFPSLKVSEEGENQQCLVFGCVDSMDYSFLNWLIQSKYKIKFFIDLANKILYLFRAVYLPGYSQLMSKTCILPMI